MSGDLCPAYGTLFLPFWFQCFLHRCVFFFSAPDFVFIFCYLLSFVFPHSCGTRLGVCKVTHHENTHTRSPLHSSLLACDPSLPLVHQTMFVRVVTICRPVKGA